MLRWLNESVRIKIENFNVFTTEVSNKIFKMFWQKFIGKSIILNYKFKLNVAQKMYKILIQYNNTHS
jgi:hypothetical protein